VCTPLMDFAPCSAASGVHVNRPLRTRFYIISGGCVSRDAGTKICSGPIKSQLELAGILAFSKSPQLLAVFRDGSTRRPIRRNETGGGR
jgi:hypothetical protein